MAKLETRFSIGDEVYLSDDDGVQDSRVITGILISKNEEKPSYYLGTCNTYPEDKLRTKDEQIVAIQAAMVKFIKGEK